MTPAAPPKIIVIGAGMAGLAAARRLAQAGASVTVLEKNAYPGGRVFSPVHEGVAIDVGAQFLASFYTETLKLIRELGLGGELVAVPGTAAILRSGRLHRLWPDARLGFTGLLSTGSKLHLANAISQVLAHWSELDFTDFPKAAALDTRSIADYARQALGDDTLEYALQPLLASLLDWTPEHTSQAMLFLLLKAGLGIRLFTLRTGLQQLPRALAARLPVLYDSEAISVAPASDGGYGIQARVAGQEQDLKADGIVCAVPASGVTNIFPELDERQRAFFAGVHYSANLIAAVGVNRRLPGDLYALFFPRREIKALASASVQSAKGAGLAPPGQDALVLSPSGPAGQDLYGRDDQAVADRLLADLSTAGPAYDVRAGVTNCQVYRWPQAIPEFEVGSIRRLKAFSEQTIETGGIVFAGDYLGGPFIEGAITSGFAAAKRLLARLPQAPG
jgi:protoporphyrinogen/coproporphyrinogen III oxidase